MKYIVMECNDKEAVLLDEKASFVKAKNKNYQVGDTIVNPILIGEYTQNSKKHTIIAIASSVATVAACIIIMVSLSIHKNTPSELGTDGNTTSIEVGQTTGETVVTDKTTEETTEIEKPTQIVTSNETTTKPESETSTTTSNEKNTENSTENSTENDNNTTEVTEQQTTEFTETQTTTAKPEIDILLEDEVKNIVIADAGIELSEVQFEEIEYDIEDGREIFEVEFTVGEKEYSYEIDAYTGEILKKEIE